MSERVKYGETYESLATNLAPYLDNKRAPVNYPAWWADTVTIYSKYENPVTNLVTWYRYVVHNCFVQQNSSLLMGNQVKYDTNNIVIRIPQQDNFKSYDKWVQVPNADMDKYLTITIGSIIIKGDIADTIDETMQGHRSTDLLAKYHDLTECIVVTLFSNNTGVGRALPHYKAMGD